MTTAIDDLVKSFLQKDSLDDCSIQELQQLSRKFPFSGAAQLLLTEKLKAGNVNAYNEQFQKTTLYFYNPLWMDQLLQAKGDAMIHTRKKENKETQPVPQMEPVPVIPAPIDEPVENSVVEEEVVSIIIENDEPETDPPPPSFAAHQPSFDETADNPEPVIDQTSYTDEPVAEDAGQPEEAETGENIPLPSFKIEAIDPATAELNFQPYHTVDYFASQGIKFREEDRPKDKFGQQLKSFTEWLKILKKAPAVEMAVSNNPNQERKVEQMAQYSVSDREVLTEAMAEVWEKQGNREKAILIYGKLSLLNPSKSSYFAAKIEQLKKT